jgi:hypothetical protein
MALKDLEVTDLLKIGAMLLLYTVYVTWWASSIQSQLDSLENHMTEHLGIENPVFQTTAIMSLIETQKATSVTLKTIAEEHIKCNIVVKNINTRLRDLEQIEAYEHKREYN